MNCLTFFSLFLSCLANGWTNYLTPYSVMAVRLNPSSYARKLGPIVGVNAVPANWHISQWGTLEDFHNAPTCMWNCGDGVLWSVSSPYASIASLGTALRFSQDSRDSDFACNEFDLLAEPDDVDIYDDAGDGMLPTGKRPTLAALSTLSVGTQQQVKSAWHGTRCPPGVNLATTLIGLVFRNPTSHQTLFYQIITYDSRGAFFRGFWFFTGPADFGVNDTVTVLGDSAMTSGGPVKNYAFDILSRLKTLIATGPNGLDKDLSHWKVGGPYIGSATNGEATITSTHGNFGLVSQ